MSVDLVCAGNLLVDDVVFADGRIHMGEPGGAVLYVGLAASLWGLRVALLSARGADYPEAALAALSARGVDLSGLRVLGERGLRTWLLYERSGRREMHQLDSPSHDEACPRPEEITADHLSARAFHVGPMPLARQRDLVDSLAGRFPGLLSLDPHEPLREENFAAYRSVIEKLDLLFVSEDEFKLRGAAADPRAALRRLRGGRLRWAAFKRGARGGLLYDARTDEFREWSGGERRAVDPTGAGDAFAAGFLAGWLGSGSVAAALEWGSVAAGIAVEDWGARGLLQADHATAEQRRRERFAAEAGS